MKNNKDSVCAVIVTYNRKNYLLNLLRALEQQTRRIEKIIIFDNFSSDGTKELLLQNGYSNIDKEMEESIVIKNEQVFLYFRNDQNTGGSGGFHDGMSIALKQDCKYIWTMDDDVLPENDCLEKLLQNITDNARICIPSRTDNNFKDYAIVDVNMSNPFKYSVKARKSKVYNENIKKDYIVVKDMPFEGPLIATSLVKEIGLPKKDLFIIFDDSEYAFRASKVTELRYVKTAILHKQIIPKKSPNRLLEWKQYYSLRNQYWFDTTFGENIFVMKIRPIFSVVELSAKAILKRKWSNLKVLKKAYQDGTQGKLGKTVNPGEKI